jgi:hypothetical protein
MGVRIDILDGVGFGEPNFTLVRYGDELYTKLSNKLIVQYLRTTKRRLFVGDYTSGMTRFFTDFFELQASLQKFCVCEA